MNGAQRVQTEGNVNASVVTESDTQPFTKGMLSVTDIDNILQNKTAFTNEQIGNMYDLQLQTVLERFLSEIKDDTKVGMDFRSEALEAIEQGDTDTMKSLIVENQEQFLIKEDLTNALITSETRNKDVDSNDGITKALENGGIDDRMEMNNTVSEHTNKLLSKSTCSKNNLYTYLKYIDANYAETYLKTNAWPIGIPIPKSPDVLNYDGSINWDKAPQGGYVLNEKGNAIRKKFLPKIGEIIDRYGAASGRYASPIINNQAYSYDQRSLPFVEDPSSYHKYQVIGDFAQIQKYIFECTDAKTKVLINAYIEKYYNGDYSKTYAHFGEIAKVDGWGSGGGLQYQFPLRIDWLVKIGLLQEI